MLNNTKNAQITFEAQGYTNVTCLIDAPGITVGGEAYGGWEVVTRPQNVGLVNWTGFQPMTLNVPLLMDNWAEQVSVEQDVQNLEKMAGRGKGVGGTLEPPAISLSVPDGFGALVPHNFNGESLDWVINALEWGDNLRRRSDGHLVRWAGTVTLLQYVTDDLIEDLSVAKRNNAHSRRRKVHIVKAGETLMRIAMTEYGNPDRWQDIAEMNGVTDPRKIYDDRSTKHLYVGRRLKLPK